MNPTINWNDPAARARLIERVGTEAYEEAQAQHFTETTVAVVNGYGIRPVSSRFGRLFAVVGTGAAFATQGAAEQHAGTLPARSNPHPQAA